MNIRDAVLPMNVVALDALVELLSVVHSDVAGWLGLHPVQAAALQDVFENALNAYEDVTGGAHPLDVPDTAEDDLLVAIDRVHAAGGYAVFP